MQNLYSSRTVLVSARPARENGGIELRAMCMDTAGPPAHPHKILYDWVGEPATPIDIALSSHSLFSRGGRADSKNGVGTVQMVHRYPTPRLRSLHEREKLEKK